MRPISIRRGGPSAAHEDVILPYIHPPPPELPKRPVPDLLKEAGTLVEYGDVRRVRIQQRATALRVDR